MNPFAPLVSYLRQLKYSLEAARMVLSPLRSRSYFPERQQKGKGQMLREQLAWVRRHHEVNKFYFMNGMDVVGGRTLDDFISDRALMRLIDWQVRQADARAQKRLANDKYRFGQLAQANGIPTPRNVALLTPDAVHPEGCTEPASYAAFVASVGSLDGFCKPVTGLGGKGAFSLRIERGILYIGEAPATPESLQARVTVPYLLQERVRQHPAMAALHPESLNTVRLVTILQGDNVLPLASFVRIGAFGSVVDNLAQGGLVVALDLHSGRLVGNGYHHAKTAYRHPERDIFTATHPTTGVRLNGYEVPFLAEGIEVACRCHRLLAPLRTVGWDVAITPEGPCIVEANTHWGGLVHTALDPSFLPRYLDLLGLTGQPIP